MNGKLLRQVLDKMLKGPVAQQARVQVCLPDGKYYDITSLQLMENKLVGVRESHRLVLTIKAESWNMGKVIRKIGG
jgi:alpha-glucosidase (family GH31 glycosyl hydrolase)